MTWICWATSVTGCQHSSRCLQTWKLSWDKLFHMTWQTWSTLYRGMNRKRLALFPGLGSTHLCPDLFYPFFFFFYPLLSCLCHTRAFPFILSCFLFPLSKDLLTPSCIPFLHSYLKLRTGFLWFPCSCVLHAQSWGDGMMLGCNLSPSAIWEGTHAVVYLYLIYPDNKQDSWLQLSLITMSDQRDPAKVMSPVLTGKLLEALISKHWSAVGLRVWDESFWASAFGFYMASLGILWLLPRHWHTRYCTKAIGHPV